MTKDIERVITPMSAELITAIDDFRFSTRKTSRSAAIRELLEFALRAHGHAPPGAGVAMDQPEYQPRAPNIKKRKP